MRISRMSLFESHCTSTLSPSPRTPKYTQHIFLQVPSLFSRAGMLDLPETLPDCLCASRGSSDRFQLLQKTLVFIQEANKPARLEVLKNHLSQVSNVNPVLPVSSRARQSPFMSCALLWKNRGRDVPLSRNEKYQLCRRHMDRSSLQKNATAICVVSSCNQQVNSTQSYRQSASIRVLE